MASAITFATLKTDVATRLGNYEDDDLYYDKLGDWVNEASNAVLMRALRVGRYQYGLFPELEDEWITDATINNQGFINVPSDCVILMGVYSFDSSGAVDISTTDRTPLSEIPWRQYQTCSKTDTGWPRLYNRYGNRIRIHPTPSSSPTDYTTKLLIIGIAEENTLSGASDTLVMDPRWHPAVVDYAVYLGATWLGWDEDAERALAACDKKIAESLSIKAYENSLSRRDRKIRNNPLGGDLGRY